MDAFIFFSLVLLFFPIFHASSLPLTSYQPCQNNISSSIKTHFTTLKSQNDTSLMQYSLDLDQTNCSKSIFEHAKNIISLEVCFDGCYLEYDQNNNNQSIFAKVSNHACSSKLLVHDKKHFCLALEALLFTLKAKAKIIENRLRFSHGVASAYGKHDGKIIGIVECLRNISLEDCDNCLGKGIEIVQEQCSGKEGGFVVVEEQCLVWFRTNCKLNHSNVSHTIMRNVENGDGDNNVDHIKRGLLLLLGIGIVIIVIIGICGCLMRRLILNRAKVGTINEVEDNKV